MEKIKLTLLERERYDTIRSCIAGDITNKEASVRLWLKIRQIQNLKRAIERLLVQPLSNLIATSQIRPGDLVRIGVEGGILQFHREAEGMSPAAMIQFDDSVPAIPQAAATASAIFENTRSQIARSSRRN